MPAAEAALAATRSTPTSGSRQVACVVNMPPRNIAGFQSQILILGARNEAGDVIILSPTSESVEGNEVF